MNWPTPTKYKFPENKTTSRIYVDYLRNNIGLVESPNKMAICTTGTSGVVAAAIVSNCSKLNNFNAHLKRKKIGGVEERAGL